MRGPGVHGKGHSSTILLTDTRDQKDASKGCSRCHEVQYCSQTCQRAHWPQHRLVCGAASEEAPPHRERHWTASTPVAVWPTSLRNPDGTVATQMQHLCNQGELVYRYAGVDTQWIGAGGSPRCALEQLALDIFDYQTASLGAEWSDEVSGAEWWIQV